MSRKVIAIGETVLDILFRDGRVVNSCPGGSMLNAAVSLGRAGNTVLLITEFGLDPPGAMIGNFLSANHVSVMQASAGDPGKTTLALASLNGAGDAAYTFYKEVKKEREIRFDTVPGKNDIILFGSFYSLSDEPRNGLVRFLKLARSNGALVIYDPNFRKPHLDDLPRLKPRILENLSLADLVRGSDEDFLFIFDAGNAGEAAGHARQAGCRKLIMTKNKEGVELITDRLQVELKVPAICPVSTIGAGDSFNAGIIHAMLKMDVRKENLDSMESEQWETVIRTGIRFATDVCKGWDNFISPELAIELKSC